MSDSIVSHVASQGYRDGIDEMTCKADGCKRWKVGNGSEFCEDHDYTKDSDVSKLWADARKTGKCGMAIHDPSTRTYLCLHPLGHDGPCSDKFNGITWEWCDRSGPSVVVTDEMRAAWKNSGHDEYLTSRIVMDTTESEVRRNAKP